MFSRVMWCFVPKCFFKVNFWYFLTLLLQKTNRTFNAGTPDTWNKSSYFATMFPVLLHCAGCCVELLFGIKLVVLWTFTSLKGHGVNEESTLSLRCERYPKISLHQISPNTSSPVCHSFSFVFVSVRNAVFEMLSCFQPGPTLWTLFILRSLWQHLWINT